MRGSRTPESKSTPPAIRVPFGADGSETTEVVPAIFLMEVADCGIYDIPDGFGGWMRSAPELHRSYLRGRDAALSEKLRPLIRFLKAWKYLNGVPISSFYLEVRALRDVSDQSRISYLADLAAVLVGIGSTHLEDASDPIGVSQSISAGSLFERILAKPPIGEAFKAIWAAIEAERRGDTGSAFESLNVLFKGEFPSYYR